MKKTWILIILLIALGVVAFIYLRQQGQLSPFSGLTGSDKTSAIEKELLGTDLGNVDQEFSEIDELLNQL